MVNILKREELSTESGTSDVAPRSRHQKKGPVLPDWVPTREQPAWGQECRQSVGVLQETTAARTAPPAGVEGDLPLSPVHTFRRLHTFSLLLLIQLKTTLLHFFILWRCLGSRLESHSLLLVDSPASSAYTEKKTTRVFNEWMWNTEMRRSLKQTKWTATGVIVRSQQSFCRCDLSLIVVLVLHFSAMCSFSPRHCLFHRVCYIAERRWSTRSGPPPVQRSCQETTAKLAVLWRQVSGPPRRRVGITCTNQWLCLISPVPPIGFVQLPWSFCGPCGRSLPIQSPERKSNYTPLAPLAETTLIICKDVNVSHTHL